MSRRADKVRSIDMNQSTEMHTFSHNTILADNLRADVPFQSNAVTILGT